MGFGAEIDRCDRAAQDHLGSVDVIYTPESGEPVTVVGLFDDAYTLLRPDNSSVEQVAPAVWLKLADLPVHPDNDDPLIQIGENYYRVRERQPDGETGGSIRLLLHRTEAPVS